MEERHHRSIFVPSSSDVCRNCCLSLLTVNERRPIICVAATRTRPRPSCEYRSAFALGSAEPCDRSLLTCCAPFCDPPSTRLFCRHTVRRTSRVSVSRTLPANNEQQPWRSVPSTTRTTRRTKTHPCCLHASLCPSTPTAAFPPSPATVRNWAAAPRG